MLSKRWSVLLVTAAVPVVWGSTYAVTTLTLPEGRPLFAAVTRALPAGLLLLALGRRLPPRGWWGRALVLGTLNIGAFFALLFVAAYRLPGGVAATVIAVQPLLVAGLSVLLLAQRLRARVVAAGVAGIGGVAMMVLGPEARLDGVGLAAAVGAAAAMASGVVLSRRWSPPVGPVAFAGWQLTAGGLVLLPVAVVLEGPAPPATDLPAVLGLAYLSLVGAALTYPLWFRGIRHLSPTRATFLGLLSPVVATALGWALLQQDLTVVQALGAAVVLTSIAAGQIGSTGATAPHTVVGEQTPPTNHPRPVMPVGPHPRART